MLVKVDEDLPKSVVALLKERGYEADSVVEQGLGGSEDADLWRVAQAEGRFQVTADKGFADIRAYPPESHAGIMLLRPDQDGIRPILRLLKQTLEKYDLQSLAGTVTVVTPRGVRVRRTL